MPSLKPILFIAVISGAFLTGCSEKPVEEQVEVIRPAKLMTLSATSDIRTLNFPAIVEALSSKDLTFQVSGQIEKLNVREGDSVNKGDVIASLDKRNFVNEVQAAQTQYDTAKLDFERAQRLVAENAIARNIFEQRKTQYEVASAQLDSAKKALEDTDLISPFSGLIAVKEAEELQVVSASDTIVALQTYGAAEALIKFPASLVARSRQIEPIETTIVLDAVPETPITAEFVSTTLEADQNSQTFDVRFGFTPPEELVILPGMTGNITSSFALRSRDEVDGQIKIPLGSVVTDSAGQFVWKVDLETMAVFRQDIEIGSGIGESLVVVSGLSAGDTIVAAGGSYLTEGMKVRRLEL